MEPLLHVSDVGACAVTLVFTQLIGGGWVWPRTLE